MSDPATESAAPVTKSGYLRTLIWMWVRHWRCKLGQGGVARYFAQKEQELGMTLDWGWNSVRCRWPQGEIWIRISTVDAIGWIVENFDFVKGRFPLSQSGQPVARWELPGPIQCRSYHQPFALWHPWFPEAADTTTGYLEAGRPASGDVVFDLGAFVGEVSIDLAELVGPTGRVLAFEPQPSVRRLLERNIAIAGVRNIETRAEALWNQTGEAEFTDVGLAGGAIASPQPGPLRSGKLVRVRTVTLEAICAELGVVPGFVKMDIEGAEIEVVEGSLDFIARHGIRFAIASYHQRDGALTARRLETLFASIGYEVKTGYPEHLTTWAWKPNQSPS